MIMREVEIGRGKEIGVNARETIPRAVRALGTRDQHLLKLRNGHARLGELEAGMVCLPELVSLSRFTV
jgi:hypothetical protein